MNQVDDCLSRGMEADRLAIYFEEIGAYQHKKNKELQGNGSSRRQDSDEVVDLTLDDDPNAMIEKEE